MGDCRQGRGERWIMAGIVVKYLWRIDRVND
jgi:hypothetical protein